MDGATKWEGAGTALLACGYGVTCGLTFPPHGSKRVPA